jgi:voltage-gated potassium channel
MNYAHIQRRTLEILEQGRANDKTSRICDLTIAAFVLVNLLAVILDSIPSVHARYGPALHTFEAISIGLFTLEYGLRVWASGSKAAPGGGGWESRKRYMKSFYGIVDVLATLPYYLQFFLPGLDLRVLRVLRFIRVFKLSHYSTAIEDLFEALRQEKRSFIAALYLLLIAILLTSTLTYFAEHHAQPDKFSSIPDAMYWAIITLTTVGYGDVSPITWVGKILSIVTALMGVSTVAVLTGIVASSFANQMARRRVIFESQLRQALADGRISHTEAQEIDRLRQLFSMSEEEAERMIDDLRKELHKIQHTELDTKQHKK